MNSNTLPRRNRKTKLRTVELRFFQDDANGEWGVTHKDTLANTRDTSGFNAFWDGRGLFHDIFEHGHEFTDKHFLGTSAMNYGGEIAAMGSMYYYMSACGMGGRLYGNSWKGNDEATIDGTLGMMQEAVEYGHFSFGDTLESSVPTQKDSGDYSLEYIISEHFARFQDSNTGKNADDEETRERCQAMKDSVTEEKLANLYRYGYRMAEKLVARSYHNGSLLTDFVEFWDKFCKEHKAENLARMFGKVNATIYRDSEHNLSWSLEFVPMYGIPSDEVSRVVIRGGTDGVRQTGELFDF